MNNFGKLALLLIVGLTLPSAEARADNIGSLISPGELSRAHTKWDGIESCTKCHVLAGGVPNGKCLECHDKISEQIKTRTGLHSKFKDPCVKCHGEHKGRDYKLFSLDEKTFDHDQTGYPLVDRHAPVPCDKCHTRPNTYKGLSRDCLTCHKDYHENKMGSDCARCHSFAGWKDLRKFDHNTASRFSLTGQHIRTPCEKCHFNGGFKIERFERCSTCHKDPHRGKPNCSKCHTTDGWKKVRIDHSITKYPLTNKHREVSCDKCHVQARLTGIPFATCNGSNCHQDVHKDQFRNRRCDDCHTTAGFKPSLFKHNAPDYTGFRLDGKHLDTPCSKCHVNGRYRPLPQKCVSCHLRDDIHKKELGANCSRCHVSADWKKLFFDHNRQSIFPLIGRHKDTACDKCHTDGKFKIQKEKCSECHRDVHRGEFKGGCDGCHTPFSWEPRMFDHAKEAGLKLQGLHNDLPCVTCHLQKGRFKGARRVCIECHIDPHFNQFGASNCAQCHGQISWSPIQFNHQQTGFPLLGHHRLAECVDCHRDRVYRSVPTECIQCHREDYQAAPGHVSGGYSQDCRTCHNTGFTSWDFNHPRLGAGAPCANCHAAEAPPSHAANNYGTACQNCHRYPSWTFIHPIGKTACALCHLSVLPAAHTAFSNRFGTVCETCHAYPSWTPAAFNHAFTPFPTNHRGYSQCSDCHPAENYGNKGGCIECHTATGARVHETTQNSGCLSCHSNGRVPQSLLGILPKK